MLSRVELFLGFFVLDLSLRLKIAACTDSKIVTKSWPQPIQCFSRVGLVGFAAMNVFYSSQIGRVMRP